jgi:hypothetical protein
MASSACGLLTMYINHLVLIKPSCTKRCATACIASDFLVRGPLAPSKLAPQTTRPTKTRPMTTRPIDNSPRRKFTPWTTRPMDNSPHGQLAPGTTRHMDILPHYNSPHGQPAPWTTRPMTTRHSTCDKKLIVYYFFIEFSIVYEHFCAPWQFFIIILHC